jgi:GWxTD domain-containing protein
MQAHLSAKNSILSVGTSKIIAVVMLLLSGFCSVGLAQKKPKLDKTYRDFIERDAVYIITKDERDDFLKLQTDEARDKFIGQFWEIRNPDPGSPDNTYKEEIYKRIAFANARFGVGSGAEGWRSDRGRTYITLGEPQQKQVFRNSANLYPLEIWFYGNPSPELPVAFFVMFYQRDGGGEYHYYSPYTDGPTKLVTGVEAINDPSSALRLISNAVGPEVARIAQSLIPDEPIDSTGQIGMESDILLAKIRGLANLPSYREDIARRRAMRENVTSRLLLEGNNLDIVTLPVRDSRGLTRLDYAIRLRNPGELALTQENDGRYSYSIEVRVTVFSADNKQIFVQTKEVKDSFNDKGLDRFKERAFGYEGTLPLPPGRYHLDIEFTDWSKRNAYRTSREVSIPASSKDAFVIPGILPFLSAEDVDPGLSDLTPFTFAGVKFKPAASPAPTLAPGSNLQVMYQIWAPPRNPKEYAGQTLDVEYALGKPAAPGSATKVTDRLSMEQFDASGDIVTGKKLSLEKQGLGNYVLALTVNRPGSADRAFATSSFRVLDRDSNPEPNDVLQPGISDDAEKGILDQQRALCYLVQGQPNEARVWFRRSLQLNHANDLARMRLVDAYFSQKDYAAVVSLFNDAGVTEATDSSTIARIAASLRERGDTPQAITLIEQELNSHPNDGPLYLALAGYYGEIGNTKKAAELAKKGKSYLTPESAKSNKQ